MNSEWLFAVRGMGMMVGRPSRSTADARPRGERSRFKATITDDIRKRVKWLHVRGWKNRPIADQMKISQSSVRRILGQLS